MSLVVRASQIPIVFSSLGMLVESFERTHERLPGTLSNQDLLRAQHLLNLSHTEPFKTISDEFVRRVQHHDYDNHSHTIRYLPNLVFVSATAEGYAVDLSLLSASLSLETAEVEGYVQHDLSLVDKLQQSPAVAGTQPEFPAGRTFTPGFPQNQQPAAPVTEPPVSCAEFMLAVHAKAKL